MKEVEWETFFFPLGIPLYHTKEAKIHFRACVITHLNQSIIHLKIIIITCLQLFKRSVSVQERHYQIIICKFSRPNLVSHSYEMPKRRKKSGVFAGWFLDWFGLVGAGLLWEENTIDWLNKSGWNQQTNRVKNMKMS